MATLACPYCYARINLREPWFRCTGRKPPGKEACKRSQDEAQVRELNNMELVLPSFEATSRGFRSINEATCPDCGVVSGVKVCSNCHSRLPATFGEGKSPLIAMAGAKHTGKTVFLRVLANQLRQGMGQRFGADVRLTGDVSFKTEDEGGHGFGDPSADLFPTGKLLAHTAAAKGGRREPMVFAWRQKRRLTGYDTTFLSFFDTAGEDLNKQDTVDNLGYLAAADALILVLDPFMIPQARDRLSLPPEALIKGTSTLDVVNRVTENLRTSHRIGGRKNIAIPVAVAFAKIDAFFDVLGEDHPLVRRPQPGPFYDDDSGRATHEHVKGLLHDWGASDIDTHLKHNYTTFRYFAISALGAEPDYRANRVDDRGVHPFRVDEPLLWLLSRFNVVPRSRAAR
ncbi:hypothetical protein [Paractinoplanes lichenicola]|uniref:Double-GTPase 2 domain-containing protein n=1 Tax=Paractinoplanes lichenicola TaxID=2802976 RepID=A0ABS1VU74_9ACTN|nr:hypothetical protein [Actinoplanes lichenicola]MBL7258035.1 hypothetical protein [Actinoplanes lichenicola]